MFNLRAATHDDCYDMWEWRNSVFVREWSFSDQKISYEDHKEWFSNKVKDENVVIYILESSKDEKTGQVRFEKLGDKVYISVCLNPDFAGKGLGVYLIEQATETYLKESGEKICIVAEIMKENVRSIRSFERAGYVFLEENKKEDIDIVRYVYDRRD